MDPQQQPSLTMTGGPEGPELQKLLMDAIMAFRQADPNASPEQYDMAQQFLKAAQDHMSSNPRMAGALADKANVIFGALKKQDPTDRGLVGLLKPFLGGQPPQE